jgi:hypothetical protein
MTLELEPNEVQFILQVLGQLPTSSGVYPLLKKIEIQTKEPEPMVVGGAD